MISSRVILQPMAWRGGARGGAPGWAKRGQVLYSVARVFQSLSLYLPPHLSPNLSVFPFSHPSFQPPPPVLASIRSHSCIHLSVQLFLYPSIQSLISYLAMYLSASHPAILATVLPSVHHTSSCPSIHVPVRSSFLPFVYPPSHRSSSKRSSGRKPEYVTPTYASLTQKLS